jgi:hypothetical protein
MTRTRTPSRRWFSFMPTDAALEVMVTLIGTGMESVVEGRTPLKHDLQLWPSGLGAVSWAGVGESRCEPDLLIRFDFDHGPPVLVIGEMKWGWVVKPNHLKDETDRQRRAMAAALPVCVQVVFVVTKFRLGSRLQDATQLTWLQVHRAATGLAQQRHGTPAGRWGSLVSTFLRKVEQIAFQGFHTGDYTSVGLERPIFWRAELVGAGPEKAEKVAFQGFHADDFVGVTTARPIFWRFENA